MRKTQKKVFGIFALAFVVAMTLFAAFLPAPKTQAMTSSVTDTITVRVIGGVPSVDTDGIDSGSTFIIPPQTVTIPYENVDPLTVSVKYTDAEGNVYNDDIISVAVNYAPDNMVINFDLITGLYDYSYVFYNADENPQTATGQGQLPHFGYGDYIFTAVGYGGDGASDEDNVSFDYIPVVADASSEENSGIVNVDLDYDPDPSTGEGTGEVTELVVNVYDKDGNKVAGPITVIAPNKTLEIPFAEYGIESGTYTLEVIAYNGAGEALYKPYTTQFVYKYGEEEEEEGSIVVPDTGKFLGNLNISRADYLATGLLLFFGVGIAGVWFIVKRDKAPKRKK